MNTYEVTYRELGKLYIKADYFDEEGSFVIFKNEASTQIAAIPAADILNILLIKENERE